MGYRHRAQHYLTPTPNNLSRDQRARLIAVASSLERRTRSPGRRRGCLGLHGIEVLRCLLFRFDGPRGCFPSLDTLQRVLGFARTTIVRAMRDLQAVGLIKITQRLQRVRIVRTSPHTGLPEEITTTVQGSNLITFTADLPRRVPLPLAAVLGRSVVRRRPAAKPQEALGVALAAMLNPWKQSS